MKRCNTREMGNKRHMTLLQISGRLCCSFIFWEEGWEENKFYPFLSLSATPCGLDAWFKKLWCWARIEERFIRRSKHFPGSHEAVNSYSKIYTLDCSLTPIYMLKENLLNTSHCGKSFCQIISFSFLNWITNIVALTEHIKHNRSTLLPRLLWGNDINNDKILWRNKSLSVLQNSIYILL